MSMYDHSDVDLRYELSLISIRLQDQLFRRDPNITAPLMKEIADQSVRDLEEWYVKLLQMNNKDPEHPPTHSITLRY